jgi:hydroxypyruvate isomerase
VTRFAANIRFLYMELPWPDRFAAARGDRFEAVESAWPTDPDAFARAVVREGLRVALLNVPAGDLDAGERGHANDPGRMPEWRRDVEAAFRLADRVACPTLNLLVGNRLPDVPLEAQWATIHENLAWALPRAAALGLTLVTELLNPKDTPDYLVADLDAARRFVASFAGAGLRLQFDTYHAGRLGLDVAAAFRDLAPLVGHVQVADAPGRDEPGRGTIDWPEFFHALADADYRGAIGLEYHPAAGTSEGLAWLPPEARPWSDRAFRYDPGND